MDREADGLKETLRGQWQEDLPQPFIGFDYQEEAFASEWQGPSEDATLYVYAKTRGGILYPPKATEGEEREVEMDLETDEAWATIQAAIDRGEDKKAGRNTISVRIRTESWTRGGPPGLKIQKTVGQPLAPLSRGKARCRITQQERT